jgi:uncharacterized cupredoxin-like copper-binding protein
MHTPSIVRLVMAALVALFIVAACAGNTGAQWTFAPVAVAETAASETVTEPVAEPAAEAPAASAAAMDHGAATADPAAESAAPVAPAGEARVIELVATGALQFTDPAGTQVKDIPVTPGETITFRIDNTAGFDHNFYIGTDEQLIAPSATTEVGIPTWQTGVQELTWVVPADISGLKFGCTVPGHYTIMQGTFSAGA